MRQPQTGHVGSRDKADGSGYSGANRKAIFMRVLMFGRLADIAGWRERAIDGPTTTGALRAHLADGDARLGEALGGVAVRAVVNQIVVVGDTPLGPDDEVAFMPPVSGG